MCGLSIVASLVKAPRSPLEARVSVELSMRKAMLVRRCDRRAVASTPRIVHISGEDPCWNNDRCQHDERGRQRAAVDRASVM